MPKLRHFAVLLALAAAAAAQQQQGDKPADPLAMVSAGEKLCAGGDAEAGLLVLWEALDGLDPADAHPVRGAAAMTARTLIARHDPLAAEREAAFAAVAKTQVAIAAAYRAKKWFDSAAERLDVAARFDPSAVGKEREVLERTRPKAQSAAAADPAATAAAPGKPAKNPLFDRDNTIAVTGTWQTTDGTRLQCAAHDGGEMLASWFTKTTHEDGRFTIEYAPTDPAANCNATICLGMVGPTTFVGIRVLCQPKNRHDILDVYRLRDNDYKLLGGITLPHKAEQDGAQRLVVEVRGATIRAFLGDAAPLECQVEQPVRGAIGVAVGLRDEPSCPVEFRRLELGPLPIDEPSDEALRAAREASAQNEIVAAVDAARAELAKKQFEAAAKRLRMAGDLAQQLAPGLLRDNLARTIDELIDRADALAQKRRKAALDCAAALTGLADAYEAKGLARIAMRFVQLAAAFTPDGMPARMQRAQAAVDAWNVQQAAQRAAELQPPADDGAVLRDWFEKGRRLFTIGASWSVAGPALRVVDLASGEVAAYMPRFGMAPLAKAAIAMRLPATSASAGFCVDVAGPHDYALIELVRLADGMGLRAWRWRDRKWTQLQSARIRIDAWRLDGWFDLTIESGAAGIVAKSGELQLTVPKSLLGVGAGQFGLAANNGAKEPITIELRAFRLPQ